MTISLGNIYDMTDLSGRIYAGNTALTGKIEALTTKVSSLGQQRERPASFGRRWATRAVTLAAVAALPGLPLTALTVGPLAILAFGLGRDRSRPQRNGVLLRGYDMVKAHGILGLPEHGFASLGGWAQTHGNDRLYKIAMGLAIGLGTVAQFARVPMALTATGGLFTVGASQLVGGLGAALFGILTERLSANQVRPQSA